MFALHNELHCLLKIALLAAVDGRLHTCSSTPTMAKRCAQVKEVREKKEAGKSRARFWEVAGSKMGKVTGAAPRLQHPTTAAVL